MNKVLWKGNNISSSYTFSNPSRMGYWTKAFMKYVKSADTYGIKATKKGFYKIMDKKLTKGNMNTFFASITQAGIVILNQEWNGSYTDSWYSIGPNWNNYLDGNLDRWNFRKHGSNFNIGR